MAAARVSRGFVTVVDQQSVLNDVFFTSSPTTLNKIPHFRLNCEHEMHKPRGANSMLMIPGVDKTMEHVCR